MASSRKVPGFSNHCGPLVGPLLGAALIPLGVTLAFVCLRDRGTVRGRAPVAHDR